MQIRIRPENVSQQNDYGSADYYYVNKSSLPKVYGGFNTSLSLKGFDLSAIFAYSIGGYIYNRDVTMILHNGSLEGRDWSTEILRRWTPRQSLYRCPCFEYYF